MQITEIRIRLVPDNGQRLKAYCTITLDGEFVVRDLKIIEGNNGLFVAMPSRKLSDRCSKCGTKNHLRARFCNECGARLGDNRILRDEAGKPKLNIDIAHPIDSQCRQRFEHAVIESYNKELEESQKPGYKPRNDEHLGDFFLMSQHDTSE